jgi:hypothetical protein
MHIFTSMHYFYLSQVCIILAVLQFSSLQSYLQSQYHPKYNLHAGQSDLESSFLNSNNFYRVTPNMDQYNI